jgi:tetratricopeptide (TPR) repeat protein
VRLLTEAAEAYSQALTVFTRDAVPQEWARIRGNLGNAYRSLGELRGGTEGARMLSEAVEIHRQALTVLPRSAFPQDWLRTQKNLGDALQAEIHLSGFATGLQQLGRLAQAEGLRDDPIFQASQLTLAVLCHVAVDQEGEASYAFASLIGLVRRQPEDFRLIWDWSPAREIIAKSTVPAISVRREGLNYLITAVTRDNKAAMLADLEKAKTVFATRAEGPKGQRAR